MPDKTSRSPLNLVYSSPDMRRRYEVWFLRVGLADGSGAWWFRYLLMNPRRNGCPGTGGAPVQVWATWFPRENFPESFIEGFAKNELSLSGRDDPEFAFRAGDNFIGPDSCRGHLDQHGHEIQWDLQYQSQFQATLSSKGWIGFSKTPHSDAKFSGSIRLDGRSSIGAALGTGLQGHNCGVRHRKFWTWAHAYFANADGTVSTLEALTYEMPLGLVFRKAILWHGGVAHIFRRFREARRDAAGMVWEFVAQDKGGNTIEIRLDGPSFSTHRLPYYKTDCSGSFEVANNSLANARALVHLRGQQVVQIVTSGGAVLEMAGTPG
jgi:hypothetical protein